MKSFDWIIIGAGPAGIAALGLLLDQGVPAESIAWLDPEFKVGALGSKWSKVSSNTSVELFLRFLQDCAAFELAHCPYAFPIQQLEPSNTCALHNIVEPLQWVTDHLCEKIYAIQGLAQQLWLDKRQWHIQLEKEIILANHVILATGSLPKTLDHPSPTVIDLDVALDPEKLSTACDERDRVAVFGSSHSAIVVIRNLLESGVRQVINFYQSPLRYAVKLDSWILFDNTGLKGDTAEWARVNLNGDLPANLVRIVSNEKNIAEHLPECTKVVYAVGFNRHHLPVVGLDRLSYNERCGIIAPGLFGCGIAFPEMVTDPLGNIEANVGLWKFMTYLKKVMPLWLKYNA